MHLKCLHFRMGNILLYLHKKKLPGNGYTAVDFLVASENISKDRGSTGKKASAAEASLFPTGSVDELDKTSKKTICRIFRVLRYRTRWE